MSSMTRLGRSTACPSNSAERTPAAGPETSVVTGVRFTLRMLAIPPFDCMRSTSASNSSASRRSSRRSRYVDITGSSRALIAVVVNRSNSRNCATTSLDVETGIPGCSSAMISSVRSS